MNAVSISQEIGVMFNMSKVMLVMDEPKKCLECPMLNGNDECILQDEDANFTSDSWEDLKNGCPLRPVPEKQKHSSIYNEFQRGAKSGYNACINEILKD